MVKNIALISLAAIMAVGSVAVDAKRIGGGKTSGAKREAATQRQATPPAAANTTPGTPATAPAAAAVPAKPAAAAAAPAAAAPKTGLAKWMPMLGGLAIGAALASMFGGGALGSMIANILMFAALGLVALFAFRWFMSRRAGGSATPALAGAGAGAAANPFGGATQRTNAEPEVFGGNRASTPAPALAQPEVIAAPESAGVVAHVPAGFDVAGFEKGAKSQFIRLQAAFDKAEPATLKDMLTDEMFAEVDRELKARGPNAHATEIVTLNAEVIEVTSESDGHWASVRFHGMLREDGKDLAEPFDEVWNMVKPLDGSAGWMLAGIQQLA